MRGDIEKILAAAVNAPSGSNSQPWQFKVSGNQIDVIAEPEKDHPILNYRNRGTWIAHGALVENILIAASALGYAPALEIFPDSSDKNVTARIKLLAGIPQAEGLFAALPRRVTNRKQYSLRVLTAEQEDYLRQSREGVDNDDVRVVWINDKSQLTRLGRVAAANEIVTLENEKLHRLFFEEIVWNREAEQKKRGGLFIKTMELKPPEQAALKLFKRWPIMAALARLGVVKKIANGNAKNYAATPLMGLVVVKNRDRGFINAGRVVERIWLKATQLGLGFHLITGTMFFWQGINLGGLSIFSRRHQQLINQEYKVLANIAGVQDQDELVTAILRVGVAPAPSAPSSKKPPKVIFTSSD